MAKQKKVAAAKNAVKKTSAPARKKPKKSVLKPKAPEAAVDIPVQIAEFIKNTPVSKSVVTSKKVSELELRKRLNKLNIKPTVSVERLRAAIDHIKPPRIPEDSCRSRSKNLCGP